MISIADALNDIIKTQPFIEEGLKRGIINFSAYAREIKPQIEKRLYKNIKEGAIIMALKRLSENYNKDLKAQPKLNLGDITLRSKITEFTYLNSPSLIDKHTKLFNELSKIASAFCAISEGVRETTLIADPQASPIIEKVFNGEQRVEKIDNLSSLTIHLPNEVVYISGVYYQILKTLAWEKINVIEVLSTLSELTVIVENKDIEIAFSALKTLN